MIALPFVAFFSLVFFWHGRSPALGWRAAYMLAAVTLAVAVVVFVEAASFFSAVTAMSVRVFWSGLTLAALALCVRYWRRPDFARARCFRWGVLEAVFGVALGAVLLATAITALFFPPNNWDSMTYHLPRVMQWAARGGIDFYPTHIGRQLLNNPGAEYCLLHIHLLAGDDRWFNFLQWWSFLGCILASSSAAKALGAGIRGQVLAAVVTATIPMAVLQASGTQNDLFISFWAMVFVGLGLMLRERFSRTVFYAAAAALGLAVLAKGTFFVVTGFVAWFFFGVLRTRLRFAVAACLIAGVLAGGHYARSAAWQKDKSFTATEQAGLLMSRHDPAAVVVNALCQAVSELVVSFSPAGRLVIEAAGRVSASLGVDARDPGVLGFAFFASPRPLKFAADEDYAPNPWHMALVMGLPLLLWLARVKRMAWSYYACAMAGWVLFFALIKWQDWITRLHLPLFILCAPLVAIAVERSKWITAGIGGLLLVLAFTVISSHATRPLFGPNHALRWERGVYYFMKKPDQAGVFFKAADVINASGCHDAGLVEGADSWEYPLWALTGFGRVKFRAIEVVGERDVVPPCLAVTLDSPREEPWHVAGKAYHKVMGLAPVQVFARMSHDR